MNQIGTAVRRATDKVDANKDGHVSRGEMRDFAEAEVRKQPWRAIAAVAVLTAMAVVAVYLMWVLVR
jgi:ElaB/YqjD/DUF883 family membrane-anchored ribosome-binding protein